MNQPRAENAGQKRLAIVCAVIAVIGAGYALWSGSPSSPVLRKDATRLSNRVYLLGRLSPSVAYAIDTSEGLVLVDSGLEPDCRSLLAQLRQLGLDPARLKKILLTHAHVDHVLGAMYLRRLTGATVHAGRRDCDILRAGGPPDAMFSTFEMPGVETHPTEIDVELQGGESIVLGDCRFEVIATPGHTPGSLCFLLRADGQRVLFSGDTISSMTGNLGTYAAYLAPRYRADAADYLASFRKLAALTAPDLLLPGHPQLAQAEAIGDPLKVNSAAIMPRQWQELTDRGIAEMQELVDRFTADGADFLDGVPRELLPGLFYLGDFDGSACYLLDRQGRLLLFNTPGGPGLAGFLEQRLEKIDRDLDAVAAILLTSCSPEATVALPSLLRKVGCPIVISRAGRAVLESRVPPGTRFVVLEDSAETSDPVDISPVRGIPLEGRGLAPAAYRFEWQGRQVLVSGELPTNPDSRQAMQELVEILRGPRGDPSTYGFSLSRLARIKPDLWLPARPLHGQNANLYDQRWQSVIEQNRDAIRYATER
ncbi:MAG: MBL fold metallo-hydrolase [Planctomycetaceae bacterium]|jgi:glyoxylase-like metal-dependent hydrolase (beta-lactamase superfamily II)|nr:MBL fold metallo-hydrolase [Planctomycetaceae bacterium]